MKRIICYGDSNTYGHLPFDGSKMSKPWPRVLAELIPEYTIIEEGLCGRATTDGKGRFTELIASGEGAELLIIMLGTNDTLKDINITPEESAENLRGYIRAWRKAFGADSKILLLSPIYITEDFKHHEYFRTVYPDEAIAKSHSFAPLYRQVAEDEGVYFADAAQYASASPIDGIHMEPEMHKAFAAAIYKKIKEEILP